MGESAVERGHKRSLMFAGWMSAVLKREEIDPGVGYPLEQLERLLARYP
jgi:hypothetical protein